MHVRYYEILHPFMMKTQFTNTLKKSTEAYIESEAVNLNVCFCYSTVKTLNRRRKLVIFHSNFQLILYCDCIVCNLCIHIINWYKNLRN